MWSHAGFTPCGGSRAGGAAGSARSWAERWRGTTNGKSRLRGARHPQPGIPMRSFLRCFIAILQSTASPSTVMTSQVSPSTPAHQRDKDSPSTPSRPMNGAIHEALRTKRSHNANERNSRKFLRDCAATRKPPTPLGARNSLMGAAEAGRKGSRRHDRSQRPQKPDRARRPRHRRLRGRPRSRHRVLLPAPLDHSVRSNLTNEPPSKRAGLQDIEARGPAQRITCQLLGIRTVSTMYTLAFAVFTLPQTTLAESLTV